MSKRFEVRVVEDTEATRPLVMVKDSVSGNGARHIQVGPRTGRYGQYYRTDMTVSDDECRALYAALHALYEGDTGGITRV